MFIDETRDWAGGNPGRLENRPGFVLDFWDFGGSTRYRSKSVEGRPVLVEFRQLTELEPRLAGCVVLECEIGYSRKGANEGKELNTSIQLREYAPPLLTAWGRCDAYEKPTSRRRTG